MANNRAHPIVLDPEEDTAEWLDNKVHDVHARAKNIPRNDVQYSQPLPVVGYVQCSVLMMPNGGLLVVPIRAAAPRPPALWPIASGSLDGVLTPAPGPAPMPAPVRAPVAQPGAPMPVRSGHKRAAASTGGVPRVFKAFQR